MTLRPDLKKKIQKWIISFHRLDPRYKILTFFNQVASEGADNLVLGDEEGDFSDSFCWGSYDYSDPMMDGDNEEQFSFPTRRRRRRRNHHNNNHNNTEESSASSRFTHIEKLLNDAFNTTSILTVWRPCSNDAMRKMMEGSGVGKGLDIKGKSAQRGLLSAFVPYMQIHKNEDKNEIQPIHPNDMLRIYYSSDELREQALDSLLREYYGNGSFVAKNEKNDAVAAAASRRRKTRTSSSRSASTSSTASSKYDLEVLDQYVSKGWYGLELSQRLFWQVYVVNQDITRDEDTHTGRPSTPGFQDANNYSLASAMKELYQEQQQEQEHTTLNNSNVRKSFSLTDSPIPVIVQYHESNALSPQYLLMAYEENDTVTPVVSDFDGFLLGWRREALWFGCNLPREQEDLMMWCVDRIEEILDGECTTDTWTVRWLDILKQNKETIHHITIPEYGFGDPKCYSIMENAALRLLDTGAVRHGAECFNYYFPQEIDDTFLLISDTLEPVPWKYVNVSELQSFLLKRIHDGFVFPLNPKWILCDPGWKQIYDELMASDALYADLSKDVWFPPHCGIRKRIKEIYAKHPNGFQRERGRVSFTADGYSPLRRNCFLGHEMSGNAAYDLAELELQLLEGRKGLLAAQIIRSTMGEDGNIILTDEEEEEEETKESSSSLSSSPTKKSSSSSSSSNQNRGPAAAIQDRRELLRTSYTKRKTGKSHGIVGENSNNYSKHNMKRIASASGDALATTTTTTSPRMNNRRTTPPTAPPPPTNNGSNNSTKKKAKSIVQKVIGVGRFRNKNGSSSKKKEPKSTLTKMVLATHDEVS